MWREVLKIRQVIKTGYHTWKAKLFLVSYEEPLRVNHKSSFSTGTTLGKNTHFNGMEIVGSGQVIIGNNFHSGNGCMMITQNHNYEGDEIPYDSSYISKNITIGDNVWIGSKVNYTEWSNDW